MSFGNLAVNASFSEGWRATAPKGRTLLKIILEKPKFFLASNQVAVFLFFKLRRP